MLFSSVIFLWIFLPVVFIGSFILDRIAGNKAANVLLLVASIFFYAWGEPVYVLLMLFSIAANFIFGIIVAKSTGHKKIWLFASVLVNLALIMYFKYAAMLVGTVNTLFGVSFTIREIALPIGISFFTFQAMSYVIDVYRGECEAQKNVFKLALYISFFPQLIAGPIVKYKDIADQIDNRKRTSTQTALGIRRFVYGFAKKILIANTLAEAADALYQIGEANLTGVISITAALFYTFQIYYDFSGYSDMAIGLGKMFGFEFKENFLYPYTSLSVREFWRRWHVSLGSWFRDYVYIPLGGSRRGIRRTCINLLIVFFLTGLWHGASWSFVLWGLFHGTFLLIERTPFGKFLDKHKAFGWVYTCLVAHVGWVFFRVEDIKTAVIHIIKMLLPWRYTTGMYSVWEFVNNRMVFTLVIAVLGMGVIQRLVPEKLAKKWKYSAVEIAFCTVLLVLCISSLAANTYNPFIYFRF
ncbi:MAG: MBOAT family protein [Lachnospiraceae bacterium]|nr:MBOAT family protein [Lachnospiraceae bacterium]